MPAEALSTDHDSDMKTILITVALLAALAGAAAYGIHVWLSLSGVEMGFHGYMALALCVVFVTGLGVGLMRLSYYSHHHGHDDRAAGRDHDAS
jgi:hypothetical protein